MTRVFDIVTSVHCLLIVSLRMLLQTVNPEAGQWLSYRSTHDNTENVDTGATMAAIYSLKTQPLAALRFMVPKPQ